MSKTFVEYKVLPQHRPAYSEWIGQVRADYPELELYEGSDQPGLFVELWSGLSRAQFEALKKARLGLSPETGNEQQFSRNFDKADWGQLHVWVSGGAAKIHVWLFEKVK